MIGPDHVPKKCPLRDTCHNCVGTRHLAVQCPNQVCRCGDHGHLVKLCLHCPKRHVASLLPKAGKKSKGAHAKPLGGLKPTRSSPKCSHSGAGPAGPKPEVAGGASSLRDGRSYVAAVATVPRVGTFDWERSHSSKSGTLSSRTKTSRPPSDALKNRKLQRELSPRWR